jgi:hypothetical protein
MALLPAAAAVLLLVPATFNVMRIRASPLYPVQAVSLLRGDRSLKANLATEFSWGEYVIWQLGPNVKVSIDGRRETLYPPAIYAHAKDFLMGRQRWDALLDDFPTDMALVMQSSPTCNLLMLKPGWRPVYQDEVSALFVRSSTHLETKLSRMAATFVPAKTTALHFP